MKCKMIFAAITAMFLTACSNSEEYIPYVEPVALQVNGDINGVATRASGNTWASGDAIGISTTGSTKTTCTNNKFKTTSTGTSAVFTAESGSEIYFQDEKSTNFTAYYPYAENTGSSITISASNSNGTDYMYATATASQSSPNAKFNFSHLMSRLVFTITPSKGFTSATPSAITVKGLTRNGVFTITGTGAGAVTPATSEKDQSEWTITDFKDNLIFIPQTATFTLAVTIDDETYSCKFSEKTFVAGYTYAYSVTVNKTGLVVTDCTITDWQSGTGDSGEATMGQK